MNLFWDQIGPKCRNSLLGATLSSNIYWEKIHTIQRLRKLVTTKYMQLILCLAIYVHTQANAGVGVQPVAGTTPEVFCAELYFFVTNLRCFICQLPLIRSIILQL
jgi:hypothetical protein